MTKKLSLLLLSVIVIVTAFTNVVNAHTSLLSNVTEAVKFYDSETGFRAGEIGTNEKVYAQINFIPEKSGNAKIVAASYKSNLSLLSVLSVNDYSLTANEAFSLTLNDLSTKDAEFIKIFVWDSVSIMPLVSSAVLPKSAEHVNKFAAKDKVLVINQPVTLGELFEGISDKIDNESVTLEFPESVTYEKDSSDWTKGMVTATNVGEITLTIYDHYLCSKTEAAFTVKEPDPIDKFAVKFENTDKYLYRVGNTGNVALGTLFKALDGVEIGNVTATITSLDSSSTASGIFNSNSDWTKATIDFNGTGPVEVTIDDDNYANALSLKLEIIDATNATTAADATSNNIVLLNDVNGAFRVSGGYTFYGNGFTVNVGTTYTAAGTQTGYIGRVNLYGGNLDNVKIVGPVYPVAYIYQKQAIETGNTLYYYNTVIVNEGSCRITNSYISGSRAALCIKSGSGDVYVENTTLSGGTFANLDMKSSSTLTLKDVTTVQEELPNSYGETDSSGNIKEMIGMGIVLDNESTILNIEGTFNQYNWIKQTQWDAMLGSNAAAFPKLFSDSKFEANRHYREGDSNPYVNAGIIAIKGWNNGANITDNRTDKTLNYSKTNVSIGGQSGGVYTIANAGTLTDAMYVAPEYEANNFEAVAPKATFDYTTLNNQPSDGTSNVYCYYDATSKKYMISFDEGGSRIWDGKILTLTKGTKTLSYTMSVSGELTVASNNTITFEDAGEYTVTYTYTDDENYRLVNGQIEKHPVTYTKTVKIEVFEIEAAALPTTFDFKSQGYRTEAANGLVYAMPNVTATSGSKSDGIAKTTIGGVDIFYPVISMYKTNASSWYNCFPVFKAVTINDCDQTTVYNTSTSSMPSNLEVIGGFILNASGTVSSAESANGTAIFNYSTGKEIKLKSYSGYGLCYYPDSSFTKSTNSRDEQTIVAKYRYTDSNGAQYYYYIGYWCEAHTKEECVTPDTLITLADGSQVRVDSLDGSEELLVWNMETGTLDSAPIMFVDSDPEAEYEITHLYFSDGTDVKVIYEHGFWDYDLNRYVYLDKNASEYIDHTFAKQNGNTLKKVVLTDVVIENSITTAWSPVTKGHLCYFVNGMLSMPGGVGGLFNIFDVNPETMTYDYASIERDIETYGLFTYEELNAIEPLSENMFNEAGGAFLKISIGKGNLTMDELITMIRRYNKFFN